MPTIDVKYDKVSADETKHGKDRIHLTLTSRVFESFGPAALGVGNVSLEGQYRQALAVVFDLEGFTKFCNQVDSHLVVPEFLTRYLNWIFDATKEKLRVDKVEDRISLWSSLPFFAKFLGDGVLYLWDTATTGGSSGIGNVILKMSELTEEYVSKLLP